jgi:hypothetical protein
VNIAAVALGAAGVALSIWNVSLAGAIARTPARERLFRVVTALAGLFLIPGLLVAMASGSVSTARVADGIWWFWPLAVTLFAVQSTWAVAARLATPVTGVPIALWNIALMVAAWANALVQHDLGAGPPPEWADATLRMAMATLVGPGALSSPLVVWLPAIGPAYPPRWGIGAAVRATIAVACAGALALAGWTVPRTRALQASFDRFGEERLTERPRGDFVTGLAILPVLDHPTPPGPLVTDLALADTMEADLLLVSIAPTVRAGALDSMARVLEESRHDSSIVAIVPSIGADAPAGPERERMLVALERAVRSLQPDIVFTEPARLAQVGTDGVRRRWFEQVRTATRRGGSKARVLPLVRTVPADKAWFLWADSAAGGMALVFDAGVGGEALDREFETARGWMALPPRAFDGTRTAWAMGPRAAPAVIGEAAQARAVWGLLAWGTRTPGVSGVIAGPSADYDAIDGLRDAGGRLRAAAVTLVRANRALHATAR